MSKYLVALLLFVPTLLDVKSLADTQNTKDRDRHDIARGSDVVPGQYPFVVLVFHLIDPVEETGSLCTGSLIAPNWVLTAAHCLVDEDGNVAEPSDVTAFVGHDFEEILTDTASRRVASQVVTHPQYNHSVLGTNDIGLIQLTQPFPVEPVSILTSAEEAIYAPSGTTATAVGWGRTENGEFPDILQHVSIPMYSLEECRRRLQPFGFGQAPGTFCAGTAAEGTRPGDSGGPLLVPFGNDWGQVGVASLASIDPELVGFPGTYVPTSIHYDWIHGHVSGSGGGGPITLSPPSNVAAEALGPHRVQISWTDTNGDNSYGFRIERKSQVGAWGLLVYQFAPSLEFIDGSVEPESSYSYRIYAYNNQEDNIESSPWSRTATATTPAVQDPAVLLTSSNRHIPHIAQGQGWSTWIYVLNTCSRPATFEIDFFGEDGRRKSFAFLGELGEEDRFNRLYNGEDPMAGKDIGVIILPDTGSELLQGFGRMNDNGEGCVSVDTEYRQERPDGGVRFSTVPLQRMTPNGLVFALSGSSCSLGVAIAGTGKNVRIEAVDYNGESMGSADLGNVYHTAFALKDKLPQLRTVQGQLRIVGEAAAVGLEFCDGELAQFRLPHYVPPGSN